MPDQNPSPNDSFSLEQLRQLTEWPDVERYINTRLRGSGSRIRELEQKLSELPDVEAMQTELEQLRAERAERETQLSAENERLFAALPDGAKSVVPDGLSPSQKNDLLRRLESQVVDKKVPVAGFGGARMGVPDAAALAADRAKFAGHRFLFGDRTKRGGRR